MHIEYIQKTWALLKGFRPGAAWLILLLAACFSREKVMAQIAVDAPVVDTLEFRITDTVYMAVDGDDGDPGTRELPVASFAKALDLLPFGGPNGEEQGYCLIRLLPGDYVVENGFRQSDNQWVRNGRYKNVSVEGIGEVVVRGTPDQPANGHMLQLRGDHIFVKNLQLKYATIHGVLIARASLQDGPIHDVVVEDVRVDSVRGFSMLFSGVERIRLERCTSAYAARLNEELVTEPCQWPSGIKFIDSRHATIRYSAVFGTRGEGLNFHNTQYGLAEFNDLHDNPTNLYLDNSARIVARHNRIYATPGSEALWETCPFNPVDSFPSIGVLIANEGACPENLTPVKDRCGTNCVIPFGPVVYRFPDVDSIFIYQNLMHNLLSAVAFWEGATAIAGVNCIRNVFIFHNTILGTLTPPNRPTRGMFDFFFPAVHNLITNSNFAVGENIRIEANIISYPDADKPFHRPVRVARDGLFPVPLELHFSNNLWSAVHPRVGPGGIVRPSMPKYLPLDSTAAWTPCPDQSEWVYEVENTWGLDYDFAGITRGALTNVGAFEFRENCGVVSNRDQPALKPHAWNVYPNPASGTLYLRTNSGKATPTRVDVFDPLGRLHITQIFNENPFALDVGALPAGIYFLNIRTKGITLETHRVVVR